MVAALSYVSNVAKLVNLCIIGSHRSSTTQMTGMIDAILFSTCSVPELSNKVLTPDPETKRLL